nr:MAG TPA: hypothetical protein [Caudoviricetes sp.]
MFNKSFTTGLDSPIVNFKILFKCKSSDIGRNFYFQNLIAIRKSYLNALSIIQFRYACVGTIAWRSYFLIWTDVNAVFVLYWTKST